MISRKSVIAVWTPLTVVSRSLLMSLIITFMFEPAKLQMNCASASGTSTCRNAGGGRPATLSTRPTMATDGACRHHPAEMNRDGRSGRHEGDVHPGGMRNGHDCYGTVRYERVSLGGGWPMTRQVRSP